MQPFGSSVETAKFDHRGQCRELISTEACLIHVGAPPSSAISREIPPRKIENLRVPRTWKGVLFVGKDFRTWCCAGDEGWPFGAALRWEASNHHMLRWLKTVVVSDVEKAHVMRQVGTGKTVRSLNFGDRCGRVVTQ